MTMDLAICQRHKQIAGFALKQLRQMNIKSTNKFWQKTSRVKRGLETSRKLRAVGYNGESYDVGVEDGAWGELADEEFIADLTFTLGAGNCPEKARVFGVLASRDERIGGSHIYRCHFDGYNHAIAVMTDEELQVGANNLRFSDFGENAIVLDGWTEDWWFPNVGKLDTIRHNLCRAGTPFAMLVRVSARICNNMTIMSKIC
jgi:hypothetical protein